MRKGSGRDDASFPRVARGPVVLAHDWDARARCDVRGFVRFFRSIVV